MGSVLTVSIAWNATPSPTIAQISWTLFSSGLRRRLHRGNGDIRSYTSEGMGPEYSFAPVFFGLAAFNASMFYCNLQIIQCLPLFARSWLSPIAAFKSQQRRSGSSKTLKKIRRPPRSRWGSLRRSSRPPSRLGRGLTPQYVKTKVDAYASGL